MKSTLICISLLSLLVAQAALAQEVPQSRVLPLSALRDMKPRSMDVKELLAKLARAKHTTTTALSASAKGGIPGIDTIQTWSDQFYSPGYDGNGNAQSVWPYTMVGRAPESGATTVINVPIVPVTVKLLNPDGSVAFTFGPSNRILQELVNSPEFVPVAYTSGIGQFNDAMLRAEFWDRIHGGGSEGDGNNWHTLLVPSIKHSRTMSIPAFNASGYPAWFVYVDANNKPLGANIDADTLDNLLFPSTVPVTNATPIGAAELAGDITTADISIFLFYNNAQFFNSDVNQCCIFGFHTYDVEPGDAHNGNRQRDYMIVFANWFSSNAVPFGQADTTTLSHELAETIHDPLLNNATPWWLNTDPIFGGDICQNNLETGDVIEVQTRLQLYGIELNGMTYHIQNEAMLPWFANEAPSHAHLGAYSFPDEATLLYLSPGPLLPGCTPAP